MQNSNFKDYIIIKNAISDDMCKILSKYIHLKATNKTIKRKDYLRNVHREYNDPLMETLLEDLTPKIEKATGLELWPTLSFCYLYKFGNKLEKHTDRSSCEIVAGLAIGADNDFIQNKKTWPLILNINGEIKPINLDFGDLVIFKGHTTEHWRETFNSNWFISAIFAYVDKNGPLSFQKFDQRKALGMPHVGMFKWTYTLLKNKLKQRYKLKPAIK